MYFDGLTRSFTEFRDSRRDDLLHLNHIPDRIRRSGMDRGCRRGVVGRIWITTAHLGEKLARIGVVPIAVYRNGRIHRIWETIRPSWRGVAMFESY